MGVIGPKKVVMGVELSGIIRKVQDINVFKQTPINQKITVNKQPFNFPNSAPIKDNCGSSTTLNYINSISWNDLRYSDNLISNDCTQNDNWTRIFDNTTKSTLLYNLDNFYISYEDPQSLQYKIGHIQNNNLGGIMISDVLADIHSDDLIFINYNSSTDLKKIIGMALGIAFGIIITIVVGTAFLWWHHKRRQPILLSRDPINDDHPNILVTSAPAITIPVTTAAPTHG